MWLAHCIRRAASLADCTAGSRKAINILMIAMTTRSSIRVKAEWHFRERLPAILAKVFIRILPGHEGGWIGLHSSNLKALPYFPKLATFCQVSCYLLTDMLCHLLRVHRCNIPAKQADRQSDFSIFVDNGV